MTGQAPAVLRFNERLATSYPYMVQIGDLRPRRAILWARSDRPSRMLVTWDTNDRGFTARRINSPYLLETSDFTGRVELQGIPDGREVEYTIQFEDLSQKGKAE